MEKVITLYSGPQCHLCTQAKALIYPLLEQSGWRLEEIDIHSDPVLLERYRVRIPVVVTSAGEEKGWPFSAGQIKRMMV